MRALSLRRDRKALWLARVERGGAWGASQGRVHRFTAGSVPSAERQQALAGPLMVADQAWVAGLATVTSPLHDGRTYVTSASKTEAARPPFSIVSHCVDPAQRPALKRSRVQAEAGGPNGFEEAHHALRYLVGPRPDRTVRHVNGGLESAKPDVICRPFAPQATPSAAELEGRPTAALSFVGSAA